MLLMSLINNREQASSPAALPIIPRTSSQLVFIYHAFLKPVAISPAIFYSRFSTIASLEFFRLSSQSKEPMINLFGLGERFHVSSFQPPSQGDYKAIVLYNITILFLNHGTIHRFVC